MGNWIDEMDKDSKREDREARERAEKYDRDIDEGSKRYDAELCRDDEDDADYEDGE